MERTNIMIIPILVILCCSHLAFGATHTLQYFYTASSGIPEFPQFITVGVVDGQQIDHYDSITKKAVQKAEWITGAVDSDYWNRNTQIYARNEAWFINNIEIAKSRFNQSGGQHTFQYMYGCEWNDETQEKNGFRRYGFDGEDFLVYDMKAFRWIAPKQQADITQRNWNNDIGQLQYYKNYITDQCIEWLQKYVMFGKDTLQKQVAPEVSVLKDSPAVVCHATGFYPEGVMITWKRDGEEMQDDVNVGETLPNYDGTFQKRAVLTVSPEDRKKSKYTCEVAHKSGTPIVKILVEDDNTLGIIIGCVIGALLVIGGIVGFVMMKKKKDYNKAEQSDTDSDTSNPIAKKGAQCGDC